MTLKAPKDLLDRLHGALVAQLLDKIESGEATAADLGVARQLLKDNGIDAIAPAGSPLDNLRASLPFPDADGVAEENARR